MQGLLFLVFRLYSLIILTQFPSAMFDPRAGAPKRWASQSQDFQAVILVGYGEKWAIFILDTWYSRR